MRITFWGAARTVTGSCYMLEHGGKRFLVDCGLFQGSKALKERNYGEFTFNPADIDFVLLTHAHIDHSGLLPKLRNRGFKGKVYATPSTVDLAAIMLPDSGYIQEMEIERKNRKLARAGQPLLNPIYTAADAVIAQKMFVPRDYGKTFKPARGISVTFHDAGHILGSAFADIRYTENGRQQKLLFTGDLGRSGHAIVNDPSIIDEADYLVMESTYGNRLHKGNAETNAPLLAEIVNDTLARGGNVVIPAFAVDRTQDILTMFHFMQEDGQIGRNSIYVDSPLAVKATEIFTKYPQYFDEVTTACYQKHGRLPFVLPNLNYVHTVEESMRLNNHPGGAIIISASGMADAGRIKHHLKHNLWHKDSTIVFIGYQAEGTLGRRLVDGEKKVTIHGEHIEVKARIVNMDGFSAHADYEEMLEWLSCFKKLPRKIFITHGEEHSALEFARMVRENTGVYTEAPQMGDMFDLLATETPLVAQDLALARLKDENVLVEINTALQTLALTRDYEKLLRVRDFLRQVS
ncbi:MAG: MBL fold metallo-hydrolase [Clostridiales bacterium]|nr:MBL fold metallo-hydrolase [Clostridiales bacterium]